MVNVSNPLVVEALESVHEYLPNLIQSTEKLAELFRENQEYNALQTMGIYIDGLDWVIGMTHSINQHEVVFSANEAIDEHLQVMNEGLSLRDFVLVADVLEYEVLPFLQNVLSESTRGH